MVDWTDTPGGLDLTIQLADPDAVPDARMVQSLLQDGMVDGVSVGFANAQDEPDPLHPGVRRFTRASLPEVSFVLAPSVPGARVLSMRSISESSLDELLDELGAGIRSGRVSQDAAHATYRAALVRHRAQQRHDDGVLHTAPPPVRRIPRDLLGQAPPEFDQFGDFQIVD